MSLYLWLNRASMMNLQKLDLQAGWEAFTLSISYINKCIKKHCVAGSLKFDVCPVIYVCNSVYELYRSVSYAILLLYDVDCSRIYAYPRDLVYSTRFILYFVYYILYYYIIYRHDIRMCAWGQTDKSLKPSGHAKERAPRRDYTTVI